MGKEKGHAKSNRLKDQGKYKNTHLIDQGEFVWTCPNDEVVNTGDVCVVCGCSRPQTTNKKNKGLPIVKIAAFLAVCILCYVIGNRIEQSQPSAPSELDAAKQSQAQTIAGDVVQVIPLYQGIAVLREDGTIDVAGNSELAEKTASWRNVCKLFYGNGNLAGLRDDRTVMSTERDLSDWENIEEIYFAADTIVGRTVDGTIVSEGFDDPAYDPAGWTDIKQLVLCRWNFYGLKEDGTVCFADPMIYHGQAQNILSWSHIEKLICDDYELFAVAQDGTVYSEQDSQPITHMKGLDRMANMRNVVGISSDDRLLTKTGKLYATDGLISTDPEDSESIICGGGIEIPLPECTGISEAYDVGNSIVFLKTDGTVEARNIWGAWDFSRWKNIQKIIFQDVDYLPAVAYGLQEDGRVVATTIDGEDILSGPHTQWRLKELIKYSEGIIGVTEDGKIVEIVGDSGDAERILSQLN